MDYILDGFIEALRLLFSFNKEVYSIIFLSIYVSFSSTVYSALIAIPSGFILGLKKFKGKKILTKILYTLMGLPPVIIGLVVAIILSRRGPLGNMGLLFTPTAMIIAQTILVTPIIMGIVFNNAKEVGPEIKNVCRTLGGEKVDILILLLKEMKITILIAIITGFGRAISEVGAVMIVGGNIKGHTRVMTSFIAMNNNMGKYEVSIAMGLVLLVISFLTNSTLHTFVKGER